MKRAFALLGATDGSMDDPQQKCEDSTPREHPLLVKYDRILAMKENENLVECPRCNSLCEQSQETPDVTCMSCKTAFCAKHGLAHEGMD